MRIKLYGCIDAEFDARRMIIDLTEHFSEVGPFSDDEVKRGIARLRAHYVVCDDCDGQGVTTRHIEPDGGGFTSSEWAEACADDPDFAENYFSGMYDRRCPACDGMRVVPEPTDDIDPRVRKALDHTLRVIWDCRQQEAMERRMGA